MRRHRSTEWNGLVEFLDGVESHQRIHLIFTHLVSLAKSLHKTCIGLATPQCNAAAHCAQNLTNNKDCRKSVRLGSVYLTLVCVANLLTYAETINTQLNTKTPFA